MTDELKIIQPPAFSVKIPTNISLKEFIEFYNDLGLALQGANFEKYRKWETK